MASDMATPRRRTPKSRSKRDSSEEKPGEPRRVVLACGHCRQRKIKCGGGEPYPCSNCVTLGKECVYTKVTAEENALARAKKQAYNIANGRPSRRAVSKGKRSARSSPSPSHSASTEDAGSDDPFQHPPLRKRHSYHHDLRVALPPLDTTAFYPPFSHVPGSDASEGHRQAYLHSHSDDGGSSSKGDEFHHHWELPTPPMETLSPTAFSPALEWAAHPASQFAPPARPPMIHSHSMPTGTVQQPHSPFESHHQYSPFDYPSPPQLHSPPQVAELTGGAYHGAGPAAFDFSKYSHGYEPSHPHPHSAYSEPMPSYQAFHDDPAGAASGLVQPFESSPPFSNAQFRHPSGVTSRLFDGDRRYDGIQQQALSIAISTASFIIGILFTSLLWDGAILFGTKGPVTPEVIGYIEAYYFTWWDGAMAVKMTMHVVLFICFVSISFRFAKYTDNSFFFSGVSLLLLLLTTSLYITITLPYVRILAKDPLNPRPNASTELDFFTKLQGWVTKRNSGPLGDVARANALAEAAAPLMTYNERVEHVSVLSAANTIAIVLLVGVVIMQIGEWYVEETVVKPVEEAIARAPATPKPVTEEKKTQ
ncbi:hypothetical protein MNV49_002020 [Pseudohyphozyma bogoriensis]|nr:hypothetical protein MNV49_002020 [Pseudohyphozyma bogoriensis]